MATNADGPAPKTEAERQLIQLLTGNQVSPEFLGQLLQGEMRDSVKAILDQQRKTYGITVNHALNPEQMVAAGGFDRIGRGILRIKSWGDDEPPERGIMFDESDTRIEKADVRLDAPTEEMGSEEELIAWVGGRGGRLLTMQELLAFAAVYPDVQRHGAVITVCYSWDDLKKYGPRAYVLGSENGKRYIEKGWDSPKLWWPGQAAKFAIVPKET